MGNAKKQKASKHLILQAFLRLVYLSKLLLAEKKGFEPSIRFPVYTVSPDLVGTPSTTRMSKPLCDHL
jgi:hypothetical protein